MEFQKVVELRRSVRKYDPDKKVDEATLKEIIEAAILAPSWKNAQTARYYVIQTEATLANFKQACLPSYNDSNCAEAPV